MAIPAYDRFYKSILASLSDGKVHDSKETMARCAEDFHLTDEEKSELLPSGRQTVLANRVGWARTYLKKAGLILTVSRGHYQITDAGRNALQKTGEAINNDYLSQFKGFQNFIETTSTNHKSQGKDGSDGIDSRTPLEIMDDADKKLKEQLADALMTTIMDQRPAFFERLVIDLLEKMGYGGGVVDASEVTGKPGDEGIDGIIREDTLGFDKIYVQAKRWSDDHVVGEPEIHQFAGALMGRGATKGLFITTSHFSKPAISFAEKYIAYKIVLVDGKDLIKLMIRYGLGVKTVQSYNVMRVDLDYFSEDNE